MKLFDELKEVVGWYVIIVILATLGLQYAEGLSFWDSMWLVFVTATSTGYGDYSAKTELGRVISVLLMHATLFFIIPCIVAHILSGAIQDANKFTHEEQEELKQKLNNIQEALDNLKRIP